MSEEMHRKMMAQFRMKLEPDMQEGEIAGSWHDTMKEMMPEMKMMPEAMEPGATPRKMIDAMLSGWRQKWGDLPDVEPWPMTGEPRMPSFPEELKGTGWQLIKVQDKSTFRP
jgi:hypothetical protein